MTVCVCVCGMHTKKGGKCQGTRLCVCVYVCVAVWDCVFVCEYVCVHVCVCTHM